MIRSYINSDESLPSFFVGTEVEKTPAHGMFTLFVVGLQPVDKIFDLLSNSDIQHVFFGANHSFVLDQLDDWKSMIKSFLEMGYLCTLDIPYSDRISDVLDWDVCKFSNFIPQIRISFPRVHAWNYNTTVKLDDVGFAATNPGVWVHNLHDLTGKSYFTPWYLYSDDSIL